MLLVCCAGTNNARLAGMLRSLASYYYKEPSLLFLVRVAQGLVHMGKGLISLTPYHTDKQLLSGACGAGREAGCGSMAAGCGTKGFSRGPVPWPVPLRIPHFLFGRGCSTRRCGGPVINRMCDGWL